MPPRPPTVTDHTEQTRCGQVALAGAPNAGKSSLLNALVGEHLALVSPKAQATRLPVTGIRTDPGVQYIFVDLPGLLDPAYLLQTRMVAAAKAALKHVDVILHLIPINDITTKSFAEAARVDSPLAAPILTLYTKGDLADRDTRQRLQDGGLVVSAIKGWGLDKLLEAIRQLLPERPFSHDPEEIGTQPLRFFVTEFVREAAFEVLAEEVPYALAVEVEEFRENETPMYIRVILLVERDSQRGIVIGRGGKTIKAIGEQARGRMEQLVGRSVYLDLWVKVLKNWRRNPSALTRLGFPRSDEEQT